MSAVPESSAAAAPDAEARILALERPDKALLVLYALRSLLALFLAPVVFVPLYFRYHTLRYRFDQQGLSAAWGILFRREIHLTYKRIQDIHVRRNLVERWLGIATVEVQTASGSQQAELTIEGVRDYDALRDFLYGRMRGHELAAAPLAAAGSPTGAATAGGGAERAVALLEDIRRDLLLVKEALERAGN